MFFSERGKMGFRLDDTFNTEFVIIGSIIGAGRERDAKNFFPTSFHRNSSTRLLLTSNYNLPEQIPHTFN